MCCFLRICIILWHTAFLYLWTYRIWVTTLLIHKCSDKQCATNYHKCIGNLLFWVSTFVTEICLHCPICLKSGRSSGCKDAIFTWVLLIIPGRVTCHLQAMQGLEDQDFARQSWCEPLLERECSKTNSRSSVTTDLLPCYYSSSTSNFP